MSTLHVWTKEETKKLITKIAYYPELWNFERHYTYRVKSLEILAAEFMTTKTEITRKIHNLRTEMMNENERIQKKKRDQGAEDGYESTWEYFEALKFMIPTEKPNEIRESSSYEKIVVENLHQRAYAPKPGGYQCVTCAESFKWKKSLEQHTKIHEPDEKSVEMTELQSSTIAIKQEDLDIDIGPIQLVKPHLSSLIKMEPADDSVTEIKLELPEMFEDMVNDEGVFQVEIKQEIDEKNIRHVEIDKTNAIYTVPNITKRMGKNERPNTPINFKCEEDETEIKLEVPEVSEDMVNEERVFQVEIKQEIDEENIRYVQPVKTDVAYTVPISAKTRMNKNKRLNTLVNVKCANEIKLELPELSEDSANQETVSQIEMKQEIDESNIRSVQPAKTNLTCSIIAKRKDQKKITKLLLEETNETYQCGICEQLFKLKYDLINHMKEVRCTETTHLACTDCGYKATSKKALTFHVEFARHTHTPPLRHSKPYQCCICGLRTAYRNRLRAHTIIQHTNEKPYECSLCNYKTAYKQYLNKHMNRQHYT